jgi:hypothetical protein
MPKRRVKRQTVAAVCVCLFLLCTEALDSDAAAPPNQLMITFGTLSERETASSLLEVMESLQVWLGREIRSRAQRRRGTVGSC